MNDKGHGESMGAHDGCVAVIQLSSGTDVRANLERTGWLLRDAKKKGAQLTVLPENFAFMGARAREKLNVAENETGGPIQDFLATTAKALRMWIVAGTIPIRLPEDPSRVAPACLVYNDHGSQVTRYDKIHLFDVDVPGSAQGRYRESATIAAGPLTPRCIDTPLGRLGLSVCYDLRFPELYRRLVADGAELIAVPSSFTRETGQAHWEVLLRARAIENQCWVLAAAQCGAHPDGRPTWGHSVVIDPWGELVGSLEDREGVVVTSIARERLRFVRQHFPALEHRRL